MAQQSAASVSCVIDLHKHGEVDTSDDDACSRTTACSGSSSQRKSGARQTVMTRSFVWADEDNSDDDFDVTTTVVVSPNEDNQQSIFGENPSSVPYVPPRCNQAFHLSDVGQEQPAVTVGAPFMPFVPSMYFGQPIVGKGSSLACAEADALDSQAEALEARAQELLGAARLLQAKHAAAGPHATLKESGSSPKSKPAAEQFASDGDSRTALMVKNLPAGCTHGRLCGILDEVGLSGLYNFIYAPFDFKKLVPLRYAFVNFERNEDALKAIATLDGFSGWVVEGEKACEATWSIKEQGLHANIERYRNSPVMHVSVPDEYKPVLFERGARIAFPAPTLTVKAPKLKV